MASVMQSLLQKIYAGTHAPLIGPSVPPLATADAAVLAPDTPGGTGQVQPQAPTLAVNQASDGGLTDTEPEENGGLTPTVAAAPSTNGAPAPAQGVMGTIGSILAPQAGSFWALAMKHGLAGASQGMIDDPLEHAAMVAKLQGLQGLNAATAAELPGRVGVSQQEVQKGKLAAAGIETNPTGNVTQVDLSHPGAPVVNNLYTPLTAQQRMMQQYQSLPDSDKAGAVGQSLLATIMGRNFMFTQPAIAAKEAIDANKNKTKTFAPKGPGKAAANRPPPGFQ